MNKKILIDEIKSRITDIYNSFDEGHKMDHIDEVIEHSDEIVSELNLDVDITLVYIIALFHDIGIQYGRDNHHITSAEILRKDDFINSMFTIDEINIMAEAIEDHRASSNNEPRSIYGKIISEADRVINIDKIIFRTISFNTKNYPEYNINEIIDESYNHIRKKYGDGGYLKLWLNSSRNLKALEDVRVIIRDEKHLKDLLLKQLMMKEK